MKVFRTETIIAVRKKVNYIELFCGYKTLKRRRLKKITLFQNLKKPKQYIFKRMFKDISNFIPEKFPHVMLFTQRGLYFLSTSSCTLTPIKGRRWLVRSTPPPQPTSLAQTTTLLSVIEGVRREQVCLTVLFWCYCFTVKPSRVLFAFCGHNLNVCFFSDFRKTGGGHGRRAREEEEGSQPIYCFRQAS